MTHINDAIRELRLSARPVFLATGNTEYPYYGVGSCFLVERQKRWYVVTARHVVKDMESVHDMVIYPSEDSDGPLPFLLGKSVKLPYTDDDACADIVVIEIDRNLLSEPDSQRTHVLNLDKISDQWVEIPKSLYYVVFGYPNESRHIDFDDSEIYALQQCIVGDISREAISTQCFVLEIINSNGCQDYNGLSGSPVFAWSKDSNAQFYPYFCGMALRGSFKNSTLEFVDSFFVNRVIDEANAS